MKYALINPNQTAQHISQWVWNSVVKQYFPIYTTYENSQLVVDTSDTEFPVAPPLFWQQCADTVQAYNYYVDATTKTINEIINVPCPANPPDSEQPQTNIETI